MDNLKKIQSLKKIKPNKEWPVLAMEQIIQTPTTQLTLLQKFKFFAKMHNNILRMFIASAATAVLILGIGAFSQTDDFILDTQTRIEINYIFANQQKTNSLIKIEIDNNRISKENETLMVLLNKRHQDRERLQEVIAKGIKSAKITYKENLSEQEIKLLLIAKKLNTDENFASAIALLKNINLD